MNIYDMNELILRIVHKSGKLVIDTYKTDKDIKKLDYEHLTMWLIITHWKMIDQITEVRISDYYNKCTDVFNPNIYRDPADFRLFERFIREYFDKRVWNQK